jgi:hypothetical protein
MLSANRRDEPVNEKAASLAAIKRADEQHRWLWAFPCRPRHEKGVVNAVWNDVGHEWVLARGVLADANDAALPARGHQSRAACLLQQTLADVRRARFAEGIAGTTRSTG